MDADVGKWRYLFADEGIVPNRCIARSKSKSSLEPVFKQCCRPLRSSHYCTMHWNKAKLTRGTWRMGNWDPDANHTSLPASDLLRGQKLAERRYVAALRRGDGDEPRLRWEKRKRRAHDLRLQKPFVCLDPSTEGSLQQWSDEPVALPPHPCMLCNADFATKSDWMAHVDADHHGICEYRKRLFYLACQFGSTGRV